MNEYLGEEALKVIVSPGCAAYLVPEGDDDAFQRAVALASSRWAGVTEPILSVLSDGTMTPADIQIAEMLDLVALVNVGCPADVTSNGVPHLGLPVMDQERLDESINLRSLPWHIGVSVTTVHVAARPNGPLWEKVAAGIDRTNNPHWSAATEDNAGRAALGHRCILDVGLAGFAASSEVSGGGLEPAVAWCHEQAICATVQVKVGMGCQLLPVRTG